MTRPASSIRQRLTLAQLAISLLFAVLTATAVWAVIGHEMDELMDQELRETGEVIHNMLTLVPTRDRVTLSTPGDAEYEEHLVWQVVDSASGAVLGHSHKAPTRALLSHRLEQPGSSADGVWRVITFGFRNNPGQLLVVAQSQSERDEAQNDAVLYTLLGAVLLGLLAAALLNWRIRRELQPLERLSAQIKNFDPLRPGTAPDAADRAELQPIEDAILDLGQRLAQRITSERAFASHAAHALRTPVAGIDAQLAIALKEAPDALRPRLGRAREATRRLSRVMQALLAMFRSGMEPQRQHLPLSELLAPLAFGELQLDLTGDDEIDADPDLFSAVLFNLLDNAQRHQAQRVQLDAACQAGWNQLRLHDDGAGCTPERLQLLRQALARQDYRAEGGLKGLGLVLADLVMRAHGGSVELPEVEAGEAGFCIELRWPDAGTTHGAYPGLGFGFSPDSRAIIAHKMQICQHCTVSPTARSRSGCATICPRMCMYC